LKEIKVPRLDSNSSYVTLTKWLVNDGDFVTAGEPVAIVETSKMTTELTSEYDGYISLMVQENTDVGVDEAIATVFETSVDMAENTDDVQEPEGVNARLSKKARELMAQYHIDMSLLPKNRIIRASDVLRLVTKPYSVSEARVRDLLICGGGGACKLVIDVVEKRGKYRIRGIIDRRFPALQEVSGIPVIAGSSRDELQSILDEGYKHVINAVAFDGKKHGRKEPYLLLKELGFSFVNVVHDSAIIEPSVQMGEGNIIAAGAIIGSEALIGSNCFINAGAIVSHDCIISDHCHVASGAILGGSVVINENTLIGQGCTIFKNVRIGRNVVIQNGANVFSNVPDNAVVRAPV
jgi:UDP-perosamine 4-acetyltransferase